MGIIRYRKRDEALGAAVATLEARVDALTRALNQVNCAHTEWTFNELDREYPIMTVYGGYSYVQHNKVCDSCGKGVSMQKEEWLQEQANISFNKHERFIERINEINTEEK